MEKNKMKTLIDYKSAPEAVRFDAVSIGRLKEIRAEIIASEQSALRTEWSRDAWESDCRAADLAVAAAQQGQTVYVAEDEDGYYFAANVIWQGTVDNLELQGFANGDAHPMRITEDADGRLMTEYAASSENEDGAIEYDEHNWEPNYQIRFRDMQPPPPEDLRARLLAENLIDA